MSNQAIPCKSNGNFGQKYKEKNYSDLFFLCFTISTIIQSNLYEISGTQTANNGPQLNLKKYG